MTNRICFSRQGWALSVGLTYSSTVYIVAAGMSAASFWWPIRYNILVFIVIPSSGPVGIGPAASIVCVWSMQRRQGLAACWWPRWSGFPRGRWGWGPLEVERLVGIFFLYRHLHQSLDLDRRTTVVRPWFLLPLCQIAIAISCLHHYLEESHNRNWNC